MEKNTDGLNDRDLENVSGGANNETGDIKDENTVERKCLTCGVIRTFDVFGTNVGKCRFCRNTQEI